MTQGTFEMKVMACVRGALNLKCHGMQMSHEKTSDTSDKDVLLCVLKSFSVFMGCLGKQRSGPWNVFAEPQWW